LRGEQVRARKAAAAGGRIAAAEDPARIRDRQGRSVLVHCPRWGDRGQAPGAGGPREDRDRQGIGTIPVVCGRLRGRMAPVRWACTARRRRFTPPVIPWPARRYPVRREPYLLGAAVISWPARWYPDRRRSG